MGSTSSGKSSFLNWLLSEKKIEEKNQDSSIWDDYLKIITYSNAIADEILLTAYEISGFYEM